MFSMIHQVGIIVLQYSAVWSNSALWFGRLVNEIWPSRFGHMSKSHSIPSKLRGHEVFYKKIQPNQLKGSGFVAILGFGIKFLKLDGAILQFWDFVATVLWQSSVLKTKIEKKSRKIIFLELLVFIEDQRCTDPIRRSCFDLTTNCFHSKMVQSS